MRLKIDKDKLQSSNIEEVELPSVSDTLEQPQETSSVKPEVQVGDLGLTMKDVEEFKASKTGTGKRAQKPVWLAITLAVLKIVGSLVGLLILVIVGVSLFSKEKQEPQVVPPSTELIVDSFVPTDTTEEEPQDQEELVDDSKSEKEGYTKYTNTYFGVSFLYPTHLYVEEKSELQLNTIHAILKELGDASVSKYEIAERNSELSSYDIPIVDFSFKDKQDSRFSLVFLGNASKKELRVKSELEAQLKVEEELEKKRLEGMTSSQVEKEKKKKEEEQKLKEEYLNDPLIPEEDGVRVPVDLSTFNTHYYLAFKQYQFDYRVARENFRDKKNSVFDFPPFTLKLENYEPNLPKLETNVSLKEVSTYTVLGEHFIEYIYELNGVQLTFTHKVLGEVSYDGFADYIDTILSSFLYTTGN